eukprot:346095_1
MGNSETTLIEHAKKEGILTDEEYPKYIHKVSKKHIRCPNMKKLQTKNPLKCPIYHSMKQNYEFNETNLNHLQQFSHFQNDFDEKPECKYGNECKTYIRSERGQDQNRIDDKCHMTIYRHPPRTRQIKLAENVHSMIINKYLDNGLKYEPTAEDDEKYGMERYDPDTDYAEPWWCNKNDEKDAWLQALITEVIDNGFKNDLCLKCGKEDECKHDVHKSRYSILKIVDQKMECNRHILMGRPLNRDNMLALILYTGCDCNYDLCATQRKGDYQKWKWFDYCLYEAIFKLRCNETGSFFVYSGLNGVKMDKKKIKNGYFATYVSASWKKEVSQAFMGNEGMIIQIDEEFKHKAGCDVSWISKFWGECEVLFARSLQGTWRGNNFSCVVSDERNGIQTVSLKLTSYPNW